MNAFEYINEMERVVKSNMVEDMDKGKAFSAQEHYQSMVNMLEILKKEFEQVEYVYQTQLVGHDKVHTFEEMTVLESQLNDEILLFQIMATTHDDITATDMQSLAEVLTKLHDNGAIKQNMIILPPKVNVFRAKLAGGDYNEVDSFDEFMKAEKTTATLDEIVWG